jgi:ribosomal protein L11 methylase PrmA
LLLHFFFNAHCRAHVQQGSDARLFDLVMANILRGPLLELQPRLTGYCKPGGRLVLSGILQEQVGGMLIVF